MVTFGDVRKLRDKLQTWQAGLRPTEQEQMRLIQRRRTEDFVKLLQEQGFPLALIAAAARALTVRHPRNPTWAAISEAAGEPKETIDPADVEQFADQLQKLFEQVEANRPSQSDS
jgi:hypothetical protein